MLHTFGKYGIGHTNKHTVCSTIFKSIMSRQAEIRYHRLILGHSRLNDHMHRIMPNVAESPNCSCGEDRETSQHFLFHCKNYYTHRAALIDNIEKGFISTNTHLSLRSIDTFTLLGQNTGLKNETTSIIKAALETFLIKTEKLTTI